MNIVPYLNFTETAWQLRSRSKPQHREAQHDKFSNSTCHYETATHLADSRWIQHDGLWLQLIQHLMHLALSSLLARLVWVGYKRVKVGLPCTWHQDGGQPFRMPDRQNVLVWAETGRADRAARYLMLHVHLAATL